MRESDIIHENGAFWVCKDRSAYTVLRNGLTHSAADSSYAKTPDGLSIAIARCDYLAKRYANDSAVATDRPGDQAARVADETGMSYSDALVFCNMD